MVVNPTVKNLRNEVSKLKQELRACENLRSIAIEAGSQLNDRFGLREVDLELAHNQIKALDIKIQEVCKHNDECRKESLDSAEYAKMLSQQLVTLRSNFNIANQKLNNAEALLIERNREISAAHERLGKKSMNEQNAMKKSVSVDIVSVGKQCGIYNTCSMTIAESKRLAIELSNIFNLAQ